MNVRPMDRGQLAFAWTVIGSVLLLASVLQPLVSARLADIPPDDLLAPMREIGGGEPLPPEVTALFAGMFANIRFSLAFAALKLVAGASILFAARNLPARWARGVLTVAAGLGIAAFAGIGIFFCYSAVIIAGAMSIPLAVALMMAFFGLVAAALPIRWLWRNFQGLRYLG
ncbi:hypothetical protein ROJ8625_03720 [Roseivivax jejudonensis]|uniref:Uncharacterized protein n=1 Tax=Roseivivax jejudonensis TaxID=1529041 RepID=A0A1X7A5S7_9RHOB|nr:hypothetical protein [Roseivivax jejudonensis]SLN71369.1 hypothetical protein ROJ8625_03720 [Roseivivax jejudonensis]